MQPLPTINTKTTANINPYESPFFAKSPSPTATNMRNAFASPHIPVPQETKECAKKPERKEKKKKKKGGLLKKVFGGGKS